MTESAMLKLMCIFKLFVLSWKVRHRLYITEHATYWIQVYNERRSVKCFYIFFLTLPENTHTLFSILTLRSLLNYLIYCTLNIIFMVTLRKLQRRRSTVYTIKNGTGSQTWGGRVHGAWVDVHRSDGVMEWQVDYVFFLLFLYESDDICLFF